MMPLNLFSLALSAVSCASFSFLASWGAQRREHALPQRVQQRPEAEARRGASAATTTKKCACCFFFLLFFFAAAFSPRLRASRRGVGASASRARPAFCSLSRRRERARDATEAPPRSDHREHRPEAPREGGACAQKHCVAIGISRKEAAAAASPGRAARRFRQHPACRGFLSPLSLSLSLFPSAKPCPHFSPKPSNAGRQAEGLPRGQPRALQGRARGE